MARAAANGIEIEYEVFGDEADPTLLLIMGLGAQMTTWPVEFCKELAGRGHQVIRFDNRDIGLSSHMDHLGEADSMAALGAAMAGEAIDAAGVGMGQLGDRGALLEIQPTRRAHASALMP